MALNKATLSEQIYQILRSDILTGRISLGQKLTLKDLERQFEVSSTPIRDALTRLTEDGLAVYYSNIGVNVILPKENDLKELYEFMGDLDSLAILHAASHPDRAALLKEAEKIVDFTGSFSANASHTEEEVQKWIHASDRFHLLFYDYCNNGFLTRAAQKLRSQLTIFSNLYETDPGTQILINEGHRQIFLLCREDRFPEAAEQMKEHLKTSLSYALACLKKL